MQYNVEMKLDILDYNSDDGEWLGEDAVTVTYDMDEGYRITLEELCNMDLDDTRTLINLLTTIVNNAERTANTAEAMKDAFAKVAEDAASQ